MRRHNRLVPRFAPLTPAALVRLIGERCLEHPGRVRVAVDGPPAARPRMLADDVADWLLRNGRPAAVVDLNDYQLPASLRLENGPPDAYGYASRWFDYQAVGREVLDPLAPERTAPVSWLPRLRDPRTDRSVRDAREVALPGQVVLVAGPMLLDRWLDFDLTVHLTLTRSVLENRSPAGEEFMVDALLEYELELVQEPDVVVRYNHPDRPAVQS
jgi:hypothetical protein